MWSCPNRPPSRDACTLEPRANFELQRASFAVGSGDASAAYRGTAARPPIVVRNLYVSALLKMKKNTVRSASPWSSTADASWKQRCFRFYRLSASGLVRRWKQTPLSRLKLSRGGFSCLWMCCRKAPLLSAVDLAGVHAAKALQDKVVVGCRTISTLLAGSCIARPPCRM